MRYLFAFFLIFLIDDVSAQLLYRVDSIAYRGYGTSNSFNKYKYSQGRGSDVFSNKYDFDSLYVRDWHNKPDWRQSRAYTSTNKIAASRYERYNDTIKNYDTFPAIFYAYDINDNEILITDSISFREEKWYDGNNNVIKRTEAEVYNNYQPRSIDTFIYDGANKLLFIYNYEPFHNDRGRTTFIYNAQGLLTNKIYHVNYSGSLSGPWMPVYEFAYQYDSIGQLIVQEEFDIGFSGIPKSITRDSFYYDHSGHLMGNFWQRPDTQTGGYKISSHGEYTYNQHWLPEAYRVTDVTKTPPKQTNEILYFYEAYFPAGVPAGTQQLDADIKLYPVPVSGVLNVHIQFAKAQACTVAIYDMNGRRLKQYKEPIADRISRTILTDDLPAGMYQLLVSSELGSETKPFNVVK